MLDLKVNNKAVQAAGDPATPLLWTLRDELGLSGTKYGCGTGLCGACTVHIDGQATRSCLISTKDAAGRAVVTIEGLDAQGNHPAQKAWRDHNVPQCGFCQAGQIMQAAALIAQNPRPSDTEITSAMAGNLCRCGCYQRIHAAVRAAANEQAAKAA